MPEETKKEEKQVTNAVDFIKDSNIFINDKYEWIKPLISKVLEDSLEEKDIDNLVKSFLPKTEEVELAKEETYEETPEEQEEVAEIKTIKSIDKVKNIGLLEREEPINLKNGLNIFYGKNGAGKSSIYLSLCKSLGKEGKNIYSNILNEEDASFCQITCENREGTENVIEWNSEEENQDQGVMIFDGDISNYIVDNEQENDFEIAYLKIQYFLYLYELYERIKNKIELEYEIFKNKQENLKGILDDKTPFIFEDIEKIKEDINKIEFTKTDNEKLSALLKKQKVLKEGSPEAIIKNLENIIEEIEKVLYAFGDDQETEKEQEIIELNYNEKYFEDINKQIAEYKKFKKAFEKSGKSKISSLLPADWIDQDLWEDFISSSVDFLETLDENASAEYTNEKCVYCHQPLKTPQAKKLIKAYQELHEEHKEKLDDKKSKLEEISNSIEDNINFLEKISSINLKIKTEFELIGKKEDIDFDFEEIKNLFIKYKNSVDKAEEIKIDHEEIKKIKSFWDIYTGLYKEFDNKKEELGKDITKKVSIIEGFDKQIQPLERRKLLFENKKKIEEYLNLQEIIDNLGEKLTDISSIKQNTSTIKTSFSKDATILEFKKNLEEEYNYFDFSPTENIKIKPSTRNGIEKRTYRIGDRELKDIFSEGERKLHSLSDFFAQCNLNDYKGVFIFDDPVNSLDQDNIERVTDRIKKLTEDGNQVLVFTHNLVFLNSLIEEDGKCTTIEKIGNQIIIEEDVKLGDKQWLKKRYKKIQDKMEKFENGTLDKNDEDEIRNVYDLISGYLENYLSVVLLSDIIGKFRSHTRMTKLNELKNLDKDKIDKMSGLFKKTNSMCSRHGTLTSAETKKPSHSELLKDIEEFNNDFKDLE